MLVVLKAELDEGGGRILLGDNTGVSSVMLWPISFQCVEFRLDCLLYAYKIRTKFRLALNSIHEITDGKSRGESYCCLTVIAVTRTRLSVAFYVHCLSCF